MRKVFIFTFIFLFVLYLLSSYVFINDFNINSYNIADNNESRKDLKIVHFTDTLINTHFTIDDLNILKDNINELEPDIVFFTGDLIDDMYNVKSDEEEKIINILKEIVSNTYKFAIYGDNDLENKNYEKIMKESDFILLDNQSYNFFYKDKDPIIITGLTNKSHIDKIIVDNKESIHFTLMHKPDVFKDIDYKTTAFSGHSLGGYVNLPFIGGIFKNDGAKTYNGNYFKEDNKTLYVSNGLGTENIHFRFNNTPSINIYYF